MKRPCKDCGEYFEPKGKYRSYCEKCVNKPERKAGRPIYKKIKSKR